MLAKANMSVYTASTKEKGVASASETDERRGRNKVSFEFNLGQRRITQIWAPIRNNNKK